MGNEHSSSTVHSQIASMNNPSAVANQLTPECFSKTYFETNSASKKILNGIGVSLYSSSTISDADLDACFELVRATSADGYRASSWGWSSKRKLNEMKEEYMRFIVLRQTTGSTAQSPLQEKSFGVLGFLSFMLTVEDDIEVVYCYEIHLSEGVRGRGLGVTLMGIMEEVGLAAGMSKSMLTVFTSNVNAQKFYERIGYTLYDEEAPPPRKRLRSRTTTEHKPTFVILAKDLK